MTDYEVFNIIISIKYLNKDAILIILFRTKIILPLFDDDNNIKKFTIIDTSLW